VTITSTEERPAAAPAEAVGPPAGPAPPSPTRATVNPGWTWTETEDAEPPRAGTSWLTWFAWAKTTGGW
jgi:hypothetical protein